MKILFQSCMILLAVLCFVCFADSAKSEPITIRFSHVVSPNTPKGLGAKMFQQMVEERLAGKVEVVIYPASQKYTDDQALLGLLFGDVEMAAPSFPKFYRFSRALQVFDLPFLFNSIDDIHRFQQSETGQALLSSMESRGIKGLGYWDNGVRVISANKPIAKPEDLKGMTLRIESSCVIREQYNNLGAIPLPMPFKLLSDSLKVGVVDGYENAWSNISAGDLQHLRPYFIELGHSYLGYMVVTSRTFWDGLPEDIRTELESILAEVTVEVNRQALVQAKEARAMVMKDDRVQVLTPDEEGKKPWKDAMLPVWQAYEHEIGPEILAGAKAAVSRK